jgi:hypothetical protein
MKLMTKELTERFAQVGSQNNAKDPIVVAHFFNPVGSGDWYMTEYDPKDRLFFGYARIFYDWNDEWGYVSLDELESYNGPWKLGIERDFFWREQPASKVIPGFTGLRS